MKLVKLLRHSAIFFLLLISSIGSANAGLIMGSQEFLDLGKTVGKTAAEVQEMINSDSSLAGYTVATDMDIASIHGVLPFVADRKYGWYSTEDIIFTELQRDVLEWYRTAYTLNYEDPQSTVPIFGYVPTYNQHNFGVISYKDSVTGLYESGQFNFLYDDENIKAIKSYNGPYAYKYDLLRTFTSGGGDKSSTKHEQVASLFVRAVEVPEPTTISIIALGLIGLASRRNKKSL